MPSDYRETAAEARKRREDLRDSLKDLVALGSQQRSAGFTGHRRMMLLQMTESLIRAHQIAKIDGNGRTLHVIEDALFHVGSRLAREI